MKLILQIALGVLIGHAAWAGVKTLAFVSAVNTVRLPKLEEPALKPAASLPTPWKTPSPAEVDRLNAETDAADANFAAEAEKCRVTTADGRTLSCPN